MQYRCLSVRMNSRPDEALKYAEQAHELQPQNPNFSDTLGWILYRKGLYSAAVKHLESAASVVAVVEAALGQTHQRTRSR